MNRQPSTARAALWMAGWLTLMLTMTVAGREATREIDVFQIMEMRSVIGLFLLYPLIRMAGGFRAVRSAVPLQQIGRNIVHYAGQFGWFYALTLIPLAQLVSIEFTMPIWTAILAAAFLGERINGWKVASIVLGLAGVVVIVRPVVGDIDPGQLVALGAAVAFGISLTMTKSLTRHDSATTIMFWMLAVQSVLGLVPAVMVWQWPSAHVWPWLLVIAFCGTFSHFCMTRAMQYADATIVVPMDFLRVPLTALLGFLLYQESIDALTFAGAALILFGNALNLRRAPAASVAAP
ncbi:MAG: DMT family transporter [Mesorhizobium sp.]|nr:DMT family transporter [Mesorhizobium sp.]